MYPFSERFVIIFFTQLRRARCAQLSKKLMTNIIAS